MTSTRLPRVLALGAALALLGVGFAAVPAQAASMTYYVNSSTSSCSDTGGGTTQAAPWCSLTRASGAYQPGDSLLLARGSSYVGQQLVLTGQGTSALPITLGAYGSGTSKPVISNRVGSTTKGDPTKADVHLKNPSYWTVQGLQLSYAGAGVVADYNPAYPGSNVGNGGLVFDDLIVDHIAGINAGVPNGNGSSYDVTCSQNAYDLFQSGGIAVTAKYATTYSTSTTFVDGVRISNVAGTNNLDVVNIDTCDGMVGDPGNPGPALPNLVKNVSITNVSARNGDGNGYSNQCNEGMRIDGATNVRIVGTEMYKLGACTVSSGTAGVILVSTSNVTIANSTLTDVPPTGSNDQTGLDNELYVDGTSLLNNVIARNAGPGVEYLSLRCIADYNSNHVVTGNVFYGNASSMRRLDVNCPPSRPFTGSIQRNLIGDSTFVEPVESFVPLIPANANNQWVTAGTTPYSGGDQFSATVGQNGWGYQVSSDVSNVANYSAATFQSGTHVFGTWTGTASQGAIGKFDQRPGSCSTCGTARTWTAPSAGTVTIRSRAMKARSGGAAVTATVLKNASSVASAQVSATDLTGQELNQTITVAAGDVLRFVVSGAGSSDDWTVWAPSIAYVDPGTAPGAQVANASFENPLLGTNQSAYAPQAPYWSFSPLTTTAGAGIAANGSSFGNSATADGRQVGFLQWGGSMSQTISGFQSGATYAVALQAALRAGNAQGIAVLIDGQQVDTITPTSTSFASYRTKSLQVGAGTHVLTLKGTANSDQTAFLDTVRILQVNTGSIGNSSFEQPARAAGTLIYAPADSSPWWFSPSSDSTGAGVAANGSAFGQAAAPSGTVAGFVQRQGAIEQAVNGLSDGQYKVQLQYAARPGNTQTVTLLVDGLSVGSFTASASAYGTWTSPSFSLSGGSTTVHSVRLQGTATSDQTAFVDSIALQTAP